MSAGAAKARSDYDVMHAYLLTWDKSELDDVITDALWRKEDVVNLILENDMLGDEYERILREARGEPEPRYCGGAKSPQEERAKYEAAMGKQTLGPTSAEIVAK